MADLSMDMLPEAENINESDLSLLFQGGVTKKVLGSTLIRWLTAMADGHGGIQSIVKKGTSGLVDTYRITLADTTTFDFTVTNGRSITKIEKTKTVGLVDTYTITYNDGTSSTFTITNGAKGDKGDTPHIWIRYASQEPTDSSHSFGVLPDDWMGQAVNYDDTAPTDWEEYTWFKIKGEKGNTGDPATIVSQSIRYLSSDSGTIIPSGDWQESIPVVTQGNYLWTRVILTYNTGSPVVSYSVSRMGLDGSGSVSSVAGISPGPDGDVALTAENVGALPTTGGTMIGGIDMNGQALSGLNDPISNDQAATKGYVDSLGNEVADVKTTAEDALPKSGGTMTGPIAMGSNRITGVGTPTGSADAATKSYVDNKRETFFLTIGTIWDGSSAPYTQSVAITGILATDMPHVTPRYAADPTTALAQREAWGMIADAEAAAGSITFRCLEDKPTTAIPVQVEVIR